MIYVTGDTHANIDIAKLNTTKFPQQKELTKNDFVIICGDFGLCWDGSHREMWWQDWLTAKNFTTLWIDGNHENFDMLYSYPVEKWNGGKIHRIDKNIIHLMRGQVFDIDNMRIFTMGGASSIDRRFRKESVSWWSQEVPSEQEWSEAFRNLNKFNNKVDYVITHAAPLDMASRIPGLSKDFYDPVERDLFNIMMEIDFKKWYFGHYHIDIDLTSKFTGLYSKIIKLGEGVEQ